ncbi:hypothetical protein OH685_13890 [Acinetobacter pittii]|nr:hypothetical protein OH685_13890 [Acinetobacter pittii]
MPENLQNTINNKKPTFRRGFKYFGNPHLHVGPNIAKKYLSMGGTRLKKSIVTSELLYFKVSYANLFRD